MKVKVKVMHGNSIFQNVHRWRVQVDGEYGLELCHGVC